MPFQVDPPPAQAGELAEPQPGAEQGEHVVPPEQRAGGEQPAGFLGGVGPALGLSQDLVGVGPPLGRRHPAQRVGGDGAFVLGELEDAEQDRAAGHQALVAELAGELVLPLADQHGLDRLDGAVAEEGSHVAPEPDLGGGQGGRAAGGVGRPHRPPLVGPPAERQPAAAAPLPGAAAHLQPLLGDQVAALRPWWRPSWRPGSRHPAAMRPGSGCRACASSPIPSGPPLPEPDQSALGGPRDTPSRRIGQAAGGRWRPGVAPDMAGSG